MRCQSVLSECSLNNPSTVISLNNLAKIYFSLGRYNEAEPLHQRALAIDEKALTLDHPNTIRCANNYAAVLRMLGRDDEARALQARFPKKQ